MNKYVVWDAAGKQVGFSDAPQHRGQIPSKDGRLAVCPECGGRPERYMGRGPWWQCRAGHAWDA